MSDPKADLVWIASLNGSHPVEIAHQFRLDPKWVDAVLNLREHVGARASAMEILGRAAKLPDFQRDARVA